MRVRSVYRCGDCGGESPKWLGRCPACSAWNTLVEELEGPPSRRSSAAPLAVAVPIGEIDADAAGHRPTGIGELDRVLGGGLVPGSVTLVGGEPGVGKSTLVLQLAAAAARSGGKALLVTAEESARQVRLRAERLGALEPGVFVVAETSLPGVVAALDQVRPDVLVVDSIQTVHDPLVESAVGSVAQVRECAARLVREAKERDVATLLIGHVTKEGNLAGPRVLEHVVDTVLAFEGDRHHALRLLRAVKHRFGSTEELGLFEMGEQGLRGVPDASSLFLADRRPGAHGSVVIPSMQGDRPLLVEVQALVSDAALGVARRWAEGVDLGRLDLLLAVLDRVVGLPLARRDVHASVVGGVRLDDTGADLAVALAVASSLLARPLLDDVAVFGEVGLGGELRQCAHAARRLAEAARLGFRRAIVPASSPTAPDGVVAVPVATVADAMRAAGLVPT